MGLKTEPQSDGRSRIESLALTVSRRPVTGDWLTIKGAVRIARARNDLLFDEEDAALIDLFSGNGTTWLGHANPRIVARLAAQLDKVWITGGFETSVHLEAVEAMERFLPATHKVAALYSTGMEAAEFAFSPPRLPFSPVSVAAREEIAEAFKDLKG